MAGPMTDEPAYEQRHFNPLLGERGEWSDWYKSSQRAYVEHVAGPVWFYEVRPRRAEALLDLAAMDGETM